MADESCYVYRLASANGTLLYVGVADQPGRRIHQHYKEKHWWAEVANVDLERFPTRRDALAAERRAIINEKPLHNIVHNADSNGRAGTIRWFCRTCTEEVRGDGLIVAHIGAARDHLRSVLAGTYYSEAPEWGLFDPFHEGCVSVDLASRHEDGKPAYLYWWVADLRTQQDLLRWMVELLQYGEIGGTYASYLIEQVLGLEVDA